MTQLDNHSLKRLAVYDPLQQDEGDFLKSFVAREKELKKLLRAIQEATTEPLTTHYLIHGQRGMGKTSLLRRIALAIRDDQQLAQQWIPLNFREEQYNICLLYTSPSPRD